jgi:hypothetical protein
LGLQVAGTDEVSLRILGDLAGDEHQPAPARDHDLGVRAGTGQVAGVDGLERHVFTRR